MDLGAGGRFEGDSRFSREAFVRRSLLLGSGLLLPGAARRLLAGDVALAARSSCAERGDVRHFVSRPDSGRRV